MQNVDLFSRPYSLEFKGSNSFSSIIGGVISTLLFISLFPIAYYFGYDTIYQSNPYISTSSAVEYINRQNVKLNFPISFQLRLNGGSLTHNNLKQYINTTIIYNEVMSKPSLDKGNALSIKESIEDNCKIENFKNVEALYNFSLLNQSFCLKNKSLFGYLMSQNQSWVTIKFYECSNGTNFTCASKNQIKDKINIGIYVNMYHENIGIRPENFSQPITKFLTNVITPYLSYSYTKRYFLYYQTVTIITDSGLFGESLSYEKFTQFGYYTFDVLDPQKDFLGITLFPSEYNIIYRRSYLKIQSVFAQIIAVFEFFIFIFQNFFFKKFYYQLFKENFFNSYCLVTENEENKIKINEANEANEGNENDNEHKQSQRKAENNKSEKVKKLSQSPIANYEQNHSRVSEIQFISKDKSKKQNTNNNKEALKKRINKLQKDPHFSKVDYGILGSIYISMCYDCLQSRLYSKYSFLQEVNDSVMNMDIKLIVDGILDIRKLKEIILEEAADEIQKIPNSKYLTIHSRKHDQSEINQISKIQQDLEEEFEEEYEENDENVNGEVIIIEKGKVQNLKDKRIETIKKKKKTNPGKMIISEDPDENKIIGQKSKFFGSNAEEKKKGNK
jgi:hypothetical protein